MRAHDIGHRLPRDDDVEFLSRAEDEMIFRRTRHSRERAGFSQLDV